ncbi:FAD-dependent oxidoreductase [Oceanobacillus sp. J11TS1]|uniref:FAD-dependent oxidoreductase n=1 Tax=Oceanobacillus sp. J11TS1 TaxID=2807191 RepID=UPI001B263B09|nr:FAD-dependent oxidoreductase [Oceanobacillus sp. J11TS1]GIO22672.1 oxidoreductase [Oceanobacillus sp. J11TS1]
MSFTSIWQADTTFSTFPKLQESKKTEVCIVGAGLTGITTAYLLSKKGIKVILLESDRILSGVTGHTTAKITAQHGIIYAELIETLGEEKAKQYYQAMQETKQFIQHEIKKNNISCNYEEQDAFVYTNDDAYMSQLEKERQAYKTLGIAGELIEQMPLQIPFKQALKMPNQAQFHPLKYLQFMLQEAVKNGIEIYEETVAMGIEYNRRPTVLTKDEHRVTCDYLVAATHFPFIDHQGLYFAKMSAERSYVVAGKTNFEYPGGMYINAENPSRSIRAASLNNEDTYLLIGGENHRSGEEKDEALCYQNLRGFAKEQFQIDDISYQWSAQDYITLDKMPYIGPITGGDPSILIATGYRKWGMTNGTLAARIITDTILKADKNPYKELFSPSRFSSKPMLKNFISYNARVAKELLKGKFDFPEAKDIDKLEIDEGTITTFKGARVGVYKDKEEQLHALDTTCTHLGCEVHWNSGDKTWDCPCHGSRFHYDGEVMAGPAKKSLRKISLDD